jgi:hypothetical protein
LATQILIPVLGVVSVLAGVRWLRGSVLKKLSAVPGK